MEHHFLSCRKDFSPHHLLFHLVYKFQCDRYNSSYYGVTHNRLKAGLESILLLTKKRAVG